MPLQINKPVHIVLLRKPPNSTFLMLHRPIEQIIRHPNIKSPVPLTRQDINEIIIHPAKLHSPFLSLPRILPSPRLIVSLLSHCHSCESRNPYILAVAFPPCKNVPIVIPAKAGIQTICVCGPQTSSPQRLYIIPAPNCNSRAGQLNVPGTILLTILFASPAAASIPLRIFALLTTA